MKKVLIITPQYPPFPRVGTTKRVVNFVRYLPGYGWEPVILTMDWGYDHRCTTGADGHRIYSTANIAKYSWDAYRKAEMGDGKPAAPSFSGRLISIIRALKNFLLVPDELILWIPLLLARAGRIIKEERPDAIYVNAPPFSPLLAGILLKKLHGIPVICDIRDDWAGNPLLEKRNRLLRAIELMMENWVSRNASGIVLVTPSSCRLWKSLHPADTAKVADISNGFSEEEYHASPTHEFPDFAFVHAGSLEANRSPEIIFKAMANLKTGGAQFSFHQFGLTIREFRKLPEAYGIANDVHFNDLIGSSEAISKTKGASALVLLPTQNAPTAIPGKAYEYLRTGKPVLLISDPNATTELMARFPKVFIVKPGDDAACLNAIKAILALGKLESAAHSDIMQFERKALCGKLAELLTAAVNKERR